MNASTGGKALLLICVALLAAYFIFPTKTLTGDRTSPSAAQNTSSGEGADNKSAFFRPQVLINRFNKFWGKCGIDRFNDSTNTAIRPISEFTVDHYDSDVSYFFYPRCDGPKIGFVVGNAFSPKPSYVTKVSGQNGLGNLLVEGILIENIDPSVDR